nr:MAG TPA: hypothetical protein [Caudoviricetes sp.]
MNFSPEHKGNSSEALHPGAKWFIIEIRNSHSQGGVYP